MLYAVPLTLRQANGFINEHHRHNKNVRGWRFGVGACDGIELWGVGVLGRTIARGAHSDTTAEILRCCVRDGAPKGTPSFLYNTLWRAWKLLGGQKCITYTLQSESGASLRGLKDAGWKEYGRIDGRDPADWQNRENRLAQDVVSEPKIRWAVQA